MCPAETVMDGATRDVVARALAQVRDDTLDARNSDGGWTGRLSSSALSTATAVSALSGAAVPGDGPLIAAGVAWLADHQNADGGWGDTTDSPSNLATTALAVAALILAGRTGAFGEEAMAATALDRARTRLDRYCDAAGGDLVQALQHVYGADRTFAVPILMNCALAGLAPWGAIPALPFELACVPHGLMRALRLHVVSYALPALIAIGQLLHRKNGPSNRLIGQIRDRATGPSLRRLEALQPESGGYLEAAPLTSFVAMSLCALGEGDGPVARRALGFLRDTVRADGAWPIDVDLALWVTSSAVTALAGAGVGAADLDRPRRLLIERQWRRVHPYTQAAPGGWAWTDRSGGVPDGDDTAGALIALARSPGGLPDDAARAGVGWLLDLQNRDGGWPTFCRGWNRLPFDQSASDITAHALRALRLAPAGVHDRRRRRAMKRGLAFLRRRQRPDGAWTPLWFGSQATADHSNPVFGTARTLRAWAELDLADRPEARRGVDFLLGAQHGDGGWGADRAVADTVEETALALEALWDWRGDDRVARAWRAGARRLAERILDGDHHRPAPIGLYFALLWYSEKMYPMVWSVAALSRVLNEQ